MTTRQWQLLGAESIALETHAPAVPGPGELLVRVRSALVCGTDLKVFLNGGHARMLNPPCPFGHELAGTVIETGPQVVDWCRGDEIVVGNSAPCLECRSCDRGRENLCADLRYLNGAFADTILVPSRFALNNCHDRPEGLSPRLAALAEPLACALHCRELLMPTLDLLASDHHAIEAVVFGAGPLGLLLVGLLAREGLEVTSADPNRQRLEAAHDFGARDSLLVVERERVVPPLLEGRAGDRFDLAIDATGRASGRSATLEAVRPGGTAVYFSGTQHSPRIALDADRVHYDEISLMGVYHHRPPLMAKALVELERDELPFSQLISETLSLDQLPRALELMRSRQALKVALDVDGSQTREQS